MYTNRSFSTVQLNQKTRKRGLSLTSQSKCSSANKKNNYLVSQDTGVQSEIFSHRQTHCSANVQNQARVTFLSQNHIKLKQSLKINQSLILKPKIMFRYTNQQIFMQNSAIICQNHPIIYRNSPPKYQPIIPQNEYAFNQSQPIQLINCLPRTNRFSCHNKLNLEQKSNLNVRNIKQGTNTNFQTNQLQSIIEKRNSIVNKNSTGPNNKQLRINQILDFSASNNINISPIVPNGDINNVRNGAINDAIYQFGKDERTPLQASKNVIAPQKNKNQKLIDSRNIERQIIYEQVYEKLPIQRQHSDSKFNPNQIRKQLILKSIKDSQHMSSKKNNNKLCRERSSPYDILISTARKHQSRQPSLQKVVDHPNISQFPSYSLKQISEFQQFRNMLNQESLQHQSQSLNAIQNRSFAAKNTEFVGKICKKKQNHIQSQRLILMNCINREKSKANVNKIKYEFSKQKKQGENKQPQSHKKGIKKRNNKRIRQIENRLNEIITICTHNS